ncbi:CRISPR-associated endonuclease Cas1, partial [Akkermansiaceae bacterium]|nr:CRISPR-associated endonuclease Cas1 [Akkermansiaceae bacterium]
MPTACVQTPGSKIRLESERLVITVPEDSDDSSRVTRRDIPLRDLDRMVMGECVSATTPALMELLRRNIPISFIDGRGGFLGSFQPASPDHGAARLRHYQRALQPEFSLAISRELISAKIHNQRRLVQRVAANRRAEKRVIPPGIPSALAALERSALALASTSEIDSLRGHEGFAAARYFPAWASLLPEAFPFVRRSTRPPLNPVNAVISFASTLIYHEMHSFLHSHGLDAALGLLHTTENGRWSLALDLMEPFRPVLAEALTLDLFSHRMLNETHFEPHNGGTYLNREGRSKLILQYEKRMARQFMSESAGHRSTLRQQLENHAILF